MAFTFEEFPNSDYYNSDLRQILKYMREFESKLDSYDTSIENLEEALESIQDLYTRVSTLETTTSEIATIKTNITELQTYIGTVESNLSTVNNTLTSADEHLQSQIDAIKLAMDTIEGEYSKIHSDVVALLEEYTLDIDTQFYELKKDLYLKLIVVEREMEELSKAFDAIDTQAKNPWREDLGKVGLQQHLDFIYNDLADECLTSEQYCRLGLSADDYSEFDLSARQYTEFGKTKLHYYWVYSPSEGYRQDISVVLTSIMDSVHGTMSADDYSALDIDADAYTALDISAFDYYGYGSTNGYLQLGMNGITASQYSTIGV